MELTNVFRIVRRWRFLILINMIVTCMVLGYRVYSAVPVYAAQIEIQLSAPQPDDAALVDRYRSTTLRDEIAVARNNFTDVLKSREVYNRTMKVMGRQSISYSVDVSPLRDSDFIYITVKAATSKLASEIANVHAEAAINYYGELRAKPAAATKILLSEQLRTATENVHAAQQALADFEAQNASLGLQNEITTYQQMIEQLQIARNQRMIEGPSNRAIQDLEKVLDGIRLDREHANGAGDVAAVKRYDDAINIYSKQLDDLRKNTRSTAGIDEVLATRRTELQHLVSLGPMNQSLQENIKQARTEYENLQTKYVQALLMEEGVKTASYLQVVTPAVAPSAPLPVNIKGVLVVGLIGSLGMAIMLAFVLDSNLAPTAVSKPTLSTATPQLDR